MKKKITVEQLTALLKTTFADIDSGRHCWIQLGEDIWFCGEPEDDDQGNGILCCYLTDKIDSFGYMFGELLCDCGIVHAEDECEDVARYALQTAEEIANVAKHGNKAPAGV